MGLNLQDPQSWCWQMLAVGQKGKERGLFVRPGNQGWGEAVEEVTKQEPVMVTEGAEDRRCTRARLAEVPLCGGQSHL